MKSVEIIILAGGKGTRMESEVPKALTLLEGKPFIRHILEAVEQCQFPNKPVVVVGYKKDMVMKALEHSYRFPFQEEQLGTGHAVKTARPLVDPNTSTVVVLFADNPFISAATIKKLVETREQSQAAIVMGTVTVPDFEAWRAPFYKSFSRVLRDDSGKVVRIVEFKDATEQEKAIREVNPCYLAFDATWMWQKLEQLDNNNTAKEYHLTDLPKFAFQEGKTIETISVDAKEALAANSVAELRALEEVLETE